MSKKAVISIISGITILSGVGLGTWYLNTSGILGKENDADNSGNTLTRKKDTEKTVAKKEDIAKDLSKKDKKKSSSEKELSDSLRGDSRGNSLTNKTYGNNLLSKLDKDNSVAILPETPKSPDKEKKTIEVSKPEKKADKPKSDNNGGNSGGNGNNNGGGSVNPTPIDPTPIDPTPIDPTPIDPIVPNDDLTEVKALIDKADADSKEYESSLEKSTESFDKLNGYSKEFSNSVQEIISAFDTHDNDIKRLESTYTTLKVLDNNILTSGTDEQKASYILNFNKANEDYSKAVKDYKKASDLRDPTVAANKKTLDEYSKEVPNYKESMSNTSNLKNVFATSLDKAKSSLQGKTGSGVEDLEQLIANLETRKTNLDTSYNKLLDILTPEKAESNITDYKKLQEDNIKTFDNLITEGNTKNVNIVKKYDTLSAMPKYDSSSDTLILVAQSGSYLTGEKAVVPSKDTDKGTNTDTVKKDTSNVKKESSSLKSSTSEEESISDSKEDEGSLIDITNNASAKLSSGAIIIFPR